VRRFVQDADPFWEPIDLEQLVGVAEVPLDCMANAVALLKSPVTIIDVMSNECGFLYVEIVPCDRNGKEQPNIVVPTNPTNLVRVNV
jgi:hypothetical protein